MPTPENISVTTNKGFWSSPNGFKTIIGIVILLIIIGLSIYFYNQGSSTVKQAQLPPNDATGQNLTDSQISQYAAQVHGDCHGIDWFADHDESIYAPILAMGNYDFVRLYNSYNVQYQPTDKQDMYGVINSSWAIPLSAWSATKASLISKFASNNITQ